MGNFTVYPGTHHETVNLLKKMGEDSFLTSQNDDKIRHNWISNEEKQIIKSVQVQASAGDVVLCHPFLAHHVAPNYTQNIRYAVFVRPTRVDHQRHIATMLEKNMWSEYIGLNNLIK